MTVHSHPCSWHVAAPHQGRCEVIAADPRADAEPNVERWAVMW